MSETTSKLSLFKYNTTADAKQPFSIKDCMNDNWDKLDAFATSVDTIFSSSFSSNLDKKVFSDINKELGKKLEADVLLAENGYIKFNNKLLICYGNIAYSQGIQTFTLPKTYTKIFDIVFGYYGSDLSNGAICATTKTVSSVTVKRWSANNFFYITIGY